MEQEKTRMVSDVIRETETGITNIINESGLDLSIIDLILRSLIGAVHEAMINSAKQHPEESTT